MDTDATPAAVWARYADVSTWAEWDAEVEHVELDGPFAAGTGGLLTLHSQEPVRFTLCEATPNVGFTNETPIPGTTLRFIHRLAELPSGGTRITHRVEIDGPAVDAMGAQLGPMIAEGIPATMRALGEAATGAAG